MAVSPEPSLKLQRHGPVGPVYREAQQCRIDIEEFARHESDAGGDAFAEQMVVPASAAFAKLR